ncbi:hypothetical protein M5K25_019449 [Dendrobium thyrsiflorum]|uniref:Secreted protein n=1 Tax=Dendrobium thyrsiflorum TaxID=117978 RepID=A0ABD0ULR0_DENTH
MGTVAVGLLHRIWAVGYRDLAAGVLVMRQLVLSSLDCRRRVVELLLISCHLVSDPAVSSCFVFCFLDKVQATDLLLARDCCSLPVGSTSGLSPLEDYFRAP